MNDIQELEPMENISFEMKQEFLVKCINQYIQKFKEKGLESEVYKYTSLVSSIELSYCDKSIEKVNHLYKIRIKIEKHIINNNFNKNYKKLNEKFVYNLEKFIKSIYEIDYFIGSVKCKSFVFDRKDLERESNE